MNKLNKSAVLAQLKAIKVLMPATIDIYEETLDFDAIKPNLDMVQTGLNYLKNAASVDVEVEDPTVDFGFNVPSGVNFDWAVLSDGHVVITLEALNADPVLRKPDLFGEHPNVFDVELKLPIICGRTYGVKQTNGLLALYNGLDPSIEYNDEVGNWVKTKAYEINDDDYLEYSFLVGAGRNIITIEVNYPEGKTITFDITTHVHFKKNDT